MFNRLLHNETPDADPAPAAVARRADGGAAGSGECVTGYCAGVFSNVHDANGDVAGPFKTWPRVSKREP